MNDAHKSVFNKIKDWAIAFVCIVGGLWFFFFALELYFFNTLDEDTYNGKISKFLRGFKFVNETYNVSLKILGLLFTLFIIGLPIIILKESSKNAGGLKKLFFNWLPSIIWVIIIVSLGIYFGSNGIIIGIFVPPIVFIIIEKIRDHFLW